jgi:hypothetical protein
MGEWKACASGQASAFLIQNGRLSATPSTVRQASLGAEIVELCFREQCRDTKR